MNQQLNRRFILVLGIALSLMACNNQGDKKEEAAATTDSASKAADTAKPIAPVKEAATDDVTVAPNLYKVLADSAGIKIVEATYKPGDSSVMHSHPDYALYTVAGGTAAFYTKDGARMVNEMKTGTVNIRPAEFHSVKNIGKTTIKVILVEVSRPQGAVALDASLDATKAAAAHYKLLRDTLGIRIIEATYKPGESSNMHGHPDAAVYDISGGLATFTLKDGTKFTNDFKTGVAFVSPAGTHTVKNVGKTTMKVLLVEVARPLK